MSTPLMDVINYVGGSVLIKSSEELQHSIMYDRELKKREESLSDPSKFIICPNSFINMPLSNWSYKGSLK